MLLEIADLFQQNLERRTSFNVPWQIVALIEDHKCMEVGECKWL